MSLINAQPRFGFDPDENSIFDYATSKSISLSVGQFRSIDGQWHAPTLAHLITTGQSVEGARVLEPESNENVQPASPTSSPTEVAPQPDVDKVEQANRDFLQEGSAGVSEAGDAGETATVAESDSAAADEAGHPQAENSVKEEQDTPA